MHDYNFHPRIEYKKRPTNKAPIFLAFLLILFLMGIIFLPNTIFKPKTDKNINTVVTNAPTKEIKPTKEYTKSASENELLTKIENILSTETGTYSVYILNLKSKQGFGINEHTFMTAASVNKIPILATLYNLAGKGEIDLEKKIVIQANDIQSYGTGVIQNSKPGGSYSLKTLARLMMEKSDNTAAYILASQVIGINRIQKFMDSLGLTQTNMNDNKSSVFDMSLLMVKIYNKEITNEALSTEILDFMDKSDFDDRIPKGVPDGIKIYHKTGDEIGQIHDVGIIDLPQKPYYLGIMTIDMTDDIKTKNNLAQISKLVYEYMKTP